MFLVFISIFHFFFCLTLPFLNENYIVKSRLHIIWRTEYSSGVTLYHASICCVCISLSRLLFHCCNCKCIFPLFLCGVLAEVMFCCVCIVCVCACAAIVILFIRGVCSTSDASISSVPTRVCLFSTALNCSRRVYIPVFRMLRQVSILCRVIFTFLFFCCCTQVWCACVLKLACWKRRVLRC